MSGRQSERVSEEEEEEERERERKRERKRTSVLTSEREDLCLLLQQTYGDYPNKGYTCYNLVARLASSSNGNGQMGVCVCV